MVGFWLVFAVDYLRQRGLSFLSFFFNLPYCCDFYIGKVGTHTWDGIRLSEEVYCM